MFHLRRVTEGGKQIDNLEKVFDKNAPKVSNNLTVASDALLAIWPGFLDDMLEMEVN